MPSSDQHTKQATHNEGLLSLLQQQARHIEYGDWFVTVAFYAALHRIEAMLYTKKYVVRGSAVRHSSDARKIWGSLSDHGARELLMKQVFSALYDPYVTLYEMSQIAKYSCHLHSEFDWSRAVSLLELIKKMCDLVCGKSG